MKVTQWRQISIWTSLVKTFKTYLMYKLENLCTVHKLSAIPKSVAPPLAVTPPDFLREQRTWKILIWIAQLNTNFAHCNFAIFFQFVHCNFAQFSGWELWRCATAIAVAPKEPSPWLTAYTGAYGHFVTATAQDVKIKIYSLYSLYSIYIYIYLYITVYIITIYILQTSIKIYQAYSSSDDLPLRQDEISSFRAVSERIVSERSLKSAFPFWIVTSPVRLAVKHQLPFTFTTNARQMLW